MNMSTKQLNDYIERLIEESNHDRQKVLLSLVDRNLISEDILEEPVIHSITEISEKMKVGKFHLGNFLNENDVDDETFAAIIEAHIANNNQFKVSSYNDEVRERIYKYMVKTNRTYMLSYGYDQEEDVRKIKAGVPLSPDLDFYNWSFAVGVVDKSILADEYLIDIYAHIINHISHYNNSCSTPEFIRWAAVETNSVKFFDMAIKTQDSYNWMCALNIIANNDVWWNDDSVLKILREYEIEDEFVVYHMMNYQYASHNYFQSYINFDSVKNAVLKINEHFEINRGRDYGWITNYNWKDALECYRCKTTSENDDKIAELYMTEKYFPIKPLTLNFHHIYSRYQLTGLIDLNELGRCNVYPKDYDTLVDLFINKLTAEQVNTFLTKIDEYRSFDVFSRLKYNQALQLVNFNKEFFAYYVYN